MTRIRDRLKSCLRRSCCKDTSNVLKGFDQTQGMRQGVVPNKNIVSALRRIVHEQGFRGWYRFILLIVVEHKFVNFQFKPALEHSGGLITKNYFMSNSNVLLNGWLHVLRRHRREQDLIYLNLDGKMPSICKGKLQKMKFFNQIDKESILDDFRMGGWVLVERWVGFDEPIQRGIYFKTHSQV